MDGCAWGGFDPDPGKSPNLHAVAITTMRTRIPPRRTARLGDGKALPPDARNAGSCALGAERRERSLLHLLERLVDQTHGAAPARAGPA